MKIRRVTVDKAHPAQNQKVFDAAWSIEEALTQPLVRRHMLRGPSYFCEISGKYHPADVVLWRMDFKAWDIDVAVYRPRWPFGGRVGYANDGVIYLKSSFVDSASPEDLAGVIAELYLQVLGYAVGKLKVRGKGVNFTLRSVGYYVRDWNGGRK